MEQRVEEPENAWPQMDTDESQASRAANSEDVLTTEGTDLHGRIRRDEQTADNAEAARANGSDGSRSQRMLCRKCRVREQWRSKQRIAGRKPDGRMIHR